MNVQTLAGQRVVDGLAVETAVALPQLHQLVDMLIEHVVAEYVRRIGNQMLEGIRLEQLERAPVHRHDPDEGRAVGDAIGRLAQEGLKIRDALVAPTLQLVSKGAVVFQPQRHRRQLEQLGKLRGVLRYRRCAFQ